MAAAAALAAAVAALAEVAARYLVAAAVVFRAAAFRVLPEASQGAHSHRAQEDKDSTAAEAAVADSTAEVEVAGSMAVLAVAGSMVDTVATVTDTGVIVALSFSMARRTYIMTTITITAAAANG